MDLPKVVDQVVYAVGGIQFSLTVGPRCKYLIRCIAPRVFDLLSNVAVLRRADISAVQRRSD